MTTDEQMMTMKNPLNRPLIDFHPSLERNYSSNELSPPPPLRSQALAIEFPARDQMLMFEQTGQS